MRSTAGVQSGAHEATAWRISLAGHSAPSIPLPQPPFQTGIVYTYIACSSITRKL